MAMVPAGWLQVSGKVPGLQQCRLLNASICEASVSLSGRGQAFQVVLYNPLAWERPTEPIRVPVSAGAEDMGWTVTGGADAGCIMGADAHTACQGACAHRRSTQLWYCRSGAGKTYTCLDGRALAVQMEVHLCSHLLLEIGVTQCTTGSAPVGSAVPPAADMLELLRQSIRRSRVLCAAFAHLPG